MNQMNHTNDLTPTSRLYVCGINPDTINELGNIFSYYGNVAEVVVMPLRNNVQAETCPTMAAIVQMTTLEAAMFVITSLPTSLLLQNHGLVVRYANNRPTKKICPKMDTYELKTPVKNYEFTPISPAARNATVRVLVKKKDTAKHLLVAGNDAASVSPYAKAASVAKDEDVCHIVKELVSNILRNIVNTTGNKTSDITIDARAEASAAEAAATRADAEAAEKAEAASVELAIRLQTETWAPSTNECVTPVLDMSWPPLGPNDGNNMLETKTLPKFEEKRYETPTSVIVSTGLCTSPNTDFDRAYTNGWNACLSFYKVNQNEVHKPIASTTIVLSSESCHASKSALDTELIKRDAKKALETAFDSALEAVFDATKAATTVATKAATDAAIEAEKKARVAIAATEEAQAKVAQLVAAQMEAAHNAAKLAAV